MPGPTGRFTRSDRLLRSSEYQHVAQHGRRATSNAFVVLVALRSTSGPGRLGVTTSRKVGNAVVRNRIRRRVREWFRRERTGIGAALDVVVIARRPAVELSSAQLNPMLTALVTRAAELR